jgi:hypothetical protein
VISKNAIFASISGIMSLVKDLSGARFLAPLMIVSFGLTACGSSSSAPVYLPSDPAPMSMPAPVAPGIEQAADDYTDAVVATAPDPIYDMAAADLTTAANRETFDVAWVHCHPNVPEHYDVTTWGAASGQATVFTDADGTKDSFELRYEDGKWRWQPTAAELAFYAAPVGDCP